MRELMIRIVVIQGISTVIALVGALLFNAPNYILPILVASAFLEFNWLVLFWVCGRIFRKKSIALGVTVIVIKYAILGLTLFYVINLRSFSVAGFLVGISTLVLTAIGFALSDRWPSMSGKSQGNNGTF